MIRIKIMDENKRTELDSKIRSYREFKSIIKDVKRKYYGK